MIQSKSKLRRVGNSWIFLSAFYQQEKWHLLLATINSLLVTLRQSGIAPDETLVYFNLHRGDSIRLTLYFNSREKDNYKFVEGPLNTFLSQNPSDERMVTKPITTFFADFPNNQIRYNLFDGHYILDGGLRDFQLLLSKILFVFFPDHPVDEEGIFTLLVFLNKAMLENLCATKEERVDLCRNIMNKLIENNKEIPDIHMEDVVFPKLISKLSYEEENEHTLLKAFGKACSELFDYSGQLITSYFTVLSIIQLHLFKKNQSVFFDSLEYILCTEQNEAIEKPTLNIDSP